LVLGAAAGAIAGKYTNVGMDEQFIKEVGSTIQPGNSALFLLVRESTPEKLHFDVLPAGTPLISIYIVERRAKNEQG
jgi:uncharacterized membrane protein